MGGQALLIEFVSLISSLEMVSFLSPGAQSGEPQISAGSSVSGELAGKFWGMGESFYCQSPCFTDFGLLWALHRAIPRTKDGKGCAVHPGQ